MKQCLAALAALVNIALPAAGLPAVAADLTFELAHDSDTERRTRTQLLRLLRRHDLGPWIRTRLIRIDDAAAPHSHPVLTLNTVHLKQDVLLLSTFLHEQVHWWLAENPGPTAAAMADLRQRFPEVPVGFPEGSRTEESSWEHLVVILLEWQGMSGVLGEAPARAAMEDLAEDHCTGLYRLVLERQDEISDVLERAGLAAPSAVPPD